MCPMMLMKCFVVIWEFLLIPVYLLTNVVSTGIDTEEKRNKLLSTISDTFEKNRQNWEAFISDQAMELIIPFI